MKNGFLLLIAILTLTSCEAYRYARMGQRGVQIAAGRVTSYTTAYKFHLDSIVVDEPMQTIEKILTDKNWTVSRELDNQMSFQYSTSPIDRTATGKQQSGTASFSGINSTETINLNLVLRGNYNFGTKKRSLEYYNLLRDGLYGKSDAEQEKPETEQTQE